MTAATTFKDHILALETLSRAEGETDFADLLRAFRTALRSECYYADDCRDAAQWIRDEAERLACRFEQAADYLDEEVGA